MEPTTDRDARLGWWREARFGMFIHWGLYALPAGSWKGEEFEGIGEWVMFKERISIAEYEELASQFNPVEFDADAWAQLALDAGMKYMIITAKHHDGFAMFASQADGFNIVDATPFGRDPVAELAAACARRGLRFGCYYSQAQDWHAPGGAIWEGSHEDWPVWEELRWDPRQAGDFDEYFQRKALGQVRELLTGYGPLGVIWFDTPLGVMSVERAGQLERLIHELQPECLVSGRLGGESQSDYDSEGDNVAPGTVRPGDWETPATLNDTWGYKAQDHNWKPAGELIFKLVDIVSKGGNYLLNVGPDALGRIPEPSQERLRAVGAWLKANGEAVYGCGATPFGDELRAETPQWRCTSKPGACFIHLFAWPTGTLQLPPLPQRVQSARLLGAPEAPVTVRQSDSGIELDLPPVAPDPVATVVALAW